MNVFDMKKKWTAMTNSSAPGEQATEAPATQVQQVAAKPIPWWVVSGRVNNPVALAMASMGLVTGDSGMEVLASNPQSTIMPSGLTWPPVVTRHLATLPATAHRQWATLNQQDRTKATRPLSHHDIERVKDHNSGKSEEYKQAGTDEDELMGSDSEDGHKRQLNIL